QVTKTSTKPVKTGVTAKSFTLNKSTGNKNLTSKKTYYVTMRGYKVVDGVKIYGPISAAVKVKVK
ncbi:MAG: hypothetical protein ACRCUS_03920, partial [Anaerovoracaceae bacterium]